MPTVEIDLRKCKGCGTCVSVCPVSLYEIVNGKSSWKKTMSRNVEITKDKFKAESDECLACKSCEASCPNNAIKIIE